MFWMLKRKLRNIKNDIRCLLKVATYLNFYKLQPFETEIIVKIMNENKDRLGFNYDYTIWKLEKRMTDKNGIKSRKLIQ